MNSRSTLLLTAFAALVSGSMAAYGDDTRNGFYQKTDQGWFWKERIPVAEVPEREEEQPKVVPLGQSTPIDQEEADEVIPLHPAYEGPRPFSPAWLREKLPEYRDKALENPTQENVRAYFYVQRYSMDMAERFALTSQKVVLSDPVLDENNRRPLSSYGARVFDERARAATDQLAKKIAGMAGVWYFYGSECPYCKEQNPVLANLQRKLDLAVLPIALDGRPMPDGVFPKWVPNRGHAEQLQVKATPTIYMVRPPNDFVLVSEGLIAETSMKQRMILGAHEAGWITDAELNSTRPVNPIQIQANLGELPEDVLNDPVKLVEILRTKITTAPYID